MNEATDTYSDLPLELREMLGKELGWRPAPVAVERALVDHWLEAYEDGNPVYYDPAVAVGSGFPCVIAPPAMLIAWIMSPYWTPYQGKISQENRQIHYEVQRLLGLPQSILSRVRLECLLPVRMGDQLSWCEVITSISTPKKTRVGTGRFWEIDQIVRNKKLELVGKLTLSSFGYCTLDGTM